MEKNIRLMKSILKSMKLKLKQIIALSLVTFLAMPSCTTDTKKAAEINFAEHKYADKIHLLDNENYPACDLDISFLAPQDTVLFKSLQESMMITFFDSLYNQSQNLEELLYLSAQDYSREFHKQEEYLSQDTMDLSATFNWQIILQNDIIYKGGGFISFLNELFAYQGGAHGNTNRNYYTFDLENNQLLSAANFFLPNKCEELKELQKQSLAKTDQELGDLWLEGLKCDDNFYLVESGIVFHYDQYEIASYAAGPIDVFISLEEIKPFLQQPELFERLEKK
jgi:hypothetical protein